MLARRVDGERIELYTAGGKRHRRARGGENPKARHAGRPVER